MSVTLPDAVRRADGGMLSLNDLAGQVLLVVNTASRCGFTGQYAGLEALHQRYGPEGLAVLAFPCNQFGAQEPGSDAEIQGFCETRFATSFPVLAKVDVNGPDAAPLFTALKDAAPGLLGSKAIKWNFTKFLVSRDRRKVERFAPNTEPAALTSAIEAMLADRSPA